MVFIFVSVQCVSMLVDILGKHFHRLILCHAEAVVNVRGIAVAVLRPLPELARVVARERGAIVLRTVLVNGFALDGKLCRADGHGHIHFLDFPFHPRAAVPPRVALLKPIIPVHNVIGAQDGVKANPVRAVRVGKVAGGINLVRFDFAQQLDNDVHVNLAQRVLLHRPMKSGTG